MRAARKPMKITYLLPDALEKRVVELSLENPDFGAQRLIPLLKQENISTSPSAVYTILKHHDLQNRDKRYAKLNQKPPKKITVPKKPSTRIPDEVTNRIIAVSLQNPDFGARRLASFLKQEGIDVAESTTYSILKRHNLNTLELRLAKIESRQLTETIPQVVEPPPPSAVPIPALARQPKPVPRDLLGRKSVSLVPSVSSKSKPIPILPSPITAAFNITDVILFA